MVQVGVERQPVLVIDDFLKHPEAMVEYAVHDAKFGPPKTVYPGVVAQTPTAYVNALAHGLGQLIASTFQVKLETAKLTDNFFGIITIPPDQLQFLQRLPHVDCCDAGRVAILHYLCDGDQGGTAFYRHRATGYETLDSDRFAEMCSMVEREVRVSGLPPAEYPSAAHRLYEQTAAVEARFNRLLVYRSFVLHSGQIGPQTRLDPDPRIGRLTTNTFISFDRV